MIKATAEQERMIENFIFLPLAKKVLDHYRKRSLKTVPLNFPNCT